MTLKTKKHCLTELSQTVQIKEPSVFRVQNPE